MKCYIFDVDGTLADGEHRIHHILTTPKNWDAYFAECGGDRPIPHMIELAQHLSTKHPIINVTGRRESTRRATLSWLWTQRVFPAAIYLRRDNDYRDDDVLKLDLLKEAYADGWEPIMVFDDRDRVVNAWRAAGIPCAQVAPGDF